MKPEMLFGGTCLLSMLLVAIPGLAGAVVPGKIVTGLVYSNPGLGVDQTQDLVDAGRDMSSTMRMSQAALHLLEIRPGHEKGGAATDNSLAATSHRHGASVKKKGAVSGNINNEEPFGSEEASRDRTLVPATSATDIGRETVLTGPNENGCAVVVGGDEMDPDRMTIPSMPAVRMDAGTPLRELVENSGTVSASRPSSGGTVIDAISAERQERDTPIMASTDSISGTCTSMIQVPGLTGYIIDSTPATSGNDETSVSDRAYTPRAR